MNESLRGHPAAGETGVDKAPTFAPLYRQIRALLLRGLQSGEWKPGEAIPSEVDLALRYRVSQGTVRKAIDELAAEHLLVRRQGRGTFVASHREVRTQFRFLRLRRDDATAALPAATAALDASGADASSARADTRSVESGSARAAERAPVAGESEPRLTMMSRVLECRRLRAPGEVARALGLRSGEGVVLIRRLLEADARPVVLDEIWLPGARFRGLTAERLDAWRGPLYAMFETEFGVPMVGAAERLKAVLADRSHAKSLQVDEGSPLLLVERVSWTYDEQPVELRRGYCVTDRHHYYNRLS